METLDWKEDFFVWVKCVDDEGHKLSDFSLEGECFHFLSHVWALAVSVSHSASLNCCSLSEDERILRRGEHSRNVSTRYGPILQSFYESWGIIFEYYNLFETAFSFRCCQPQKKLGQLNHTKTIMVHKFSQSINKQLLWSAVLKETWRCLGGVRDWL